MVKISFDEAANLLLDTCASRLSRRVLHPRGRESLDVQIPDLIVPTALFSVRSTVLFLLAHWDANLLKDSSTISHFASSPRI